MREPDLVGVARAWKIRMSPEIIAAHEREWGYVDSSLSTWIVFGPYHPFWSWWHVGCIHLRPIPGGPPANKAYSEAEFEFAIYSLNPTPEPPRPGTPDVDLLEAGDTLHAMPGFLSPPDVQFQFHGVSDEQAAAICDVAVEHIVAGQSCDSDFRRWWEESLTATVAHYVSGEHG